MVDFILEIIDFILEEINSINLIDKFVFLKKIRRNNPFVFLFFFTLIGILMKLIFNIISIYSWSYIKIITFPILTAILLFFIGKTFGFLFQRINAFSQIIYSILALFFIIIVYSSSDYIQYKTMGLEYAKYYNLPLEQGNQKVEEYLTKNTGKKGIVAYFDILFKKKNDYLSVIKDDLIKMEDDSNIKGEVDIFGFVLDLIQAGFEKVSDMLEFKFPGLISYSFWFLIGLYIFYLGFRNGTIEYIEYIEGIKFRLFHK